MAARGKRGGGKSKEQKAADKKTKMQDAASGQTTLNIPKPRDLKHHYTTILGAKARVDEAMGHYRNALKQADESGVDTGAIRFVMTKSKKDPMVLKSFLQQVAEHFKEQGMPFQINLFDTINGTPEEQAYKQGYAVGTAGETPNNPYPAGSAPHARYERAVAHGLGHNLGQTPQQVDEALDGIGGSAQQQAEQQRVVDQAGESGGTVHKGPWPDDKQVEEGKTEPETVN